MIRRVVLDSSALVALLADGGREGEWVAGEIAEATLVGPHLCLIETADVLRRQEASGALTTVAAGEALDDLLALPIALWPYEPLARRTWELRRNLTIYDATYVALAELVEATLVTLDARMSRAPGLRCAVAVAPGE